VILRIAVIGTGLIGELHARILARNASCVLAAVCDVDLGRAQLLASELGCKAYAGFQQMFDEVELDAVTIATPETHRHAPAEAAAALGLHMLLEKPLGRTIEQVDTLIDTMEAHGAEPAVNFILHADPRYAKMRHMVAQGAVGNTVSFFARRRGSREGMKRYGPWTDLLSSTLIHDIEMVLSTNTAPAERVHAEAVIRKCAQWGSHDAVVATMRFEDGAVAMFESSWVMPPTAPDGLDPAFHLIGDGGSIIIEGSSQGMRVSSETGYTHPDVTHWPILPDGVGGALARSVDMFVERVRNGQPPLVGLAQARRAEAAVAAIKRSISEGRSVQMSELARGAR
jgi:predicted dehydrogenase